MNTLPSSLFGDDNDSSCRARSALRASQTIMASFLVIKI